jgi:hypothetical protein
MAPSIDVKGRRRFADTQASSSSSGKLLLDVTPLGVGVAQVGRELLS